uniref:Uncharacterized protein n=1 Tax=Pithovirus LCPAC103 TaxID=2506588 RepID=A0A481Z3E8_9VIRU|nr:MAG: hypothetical protein LCPAC103_00380 [Pithovirus LCPAC103]
MDAKLTVTVSASIYGVGSTFLTASVLKPRILVQEHFSGLIKINEVSYVFCQESIKSTIFTITMTLTPSHLFDLSINGIVVLSFFLNDVNFDLVF